MSKYVETIKYGDEHAQKQCIILDQHSSRGEEFFERYPGIRESLEVTEQCFDDFVNLERDAGAGELAGRVANIVAEESNGDTSVTVVKSHLPRAVLDTNRVTSKAVRNIIDYANNRGLEAKLKEVHFGVISEIRRQLSTLLCFDGVFVDVHTMAPYTPRVFPQSQTDVVTVKPDNLSNYIRAYLSALKFGRRRYIDVVTSLPGLPPLADPLITADIKTELDRNHIRYLENDPYPTGPYVMSTEYMSHFPGVLIETPKDYLTDSHTESESFDLINPVVCAERVEKIARPLAEAVIKRLNSAR